MFINSFFDIVGHSDIKRSRVAGHYINVECFHADIVPGTRQSYSSKRKKISVPGSPLRSVSPLAALGRNDSGLCQALDRNDSGWWRLRSK